MAVFAYQLFYWLGKVTIQKYSRILIINFAINVMPRNIIWSRFVSGIISLD
jgi:hypothetical protein